MRQIAGVFAQLEKARLVSKLKAARDRKRATGAKVEGCKSYAEIDAAEHGGKMIALGSELGHLLAYEINFRFNVPHDLSVVFLAGATATSNDRLRLDLSAMVGRNGHVD